MSSLPPKGARLAWGGPARRRSLGFTLIELLVVVSIIGIATAGVAFAMRDSGQTQLEREAQRLAVLLESARAHSRSSGLPVRWMGTPQGFRFEGLPPKTLPEQWLNSDTSTTSVQPLTLGPEPLIGKQMVTLINRSVAGKRISIGTDGLRPFSVLSSDSLTP